MVETRTNTVILSFTGSHRFLSNFFIEPDGTHVEREYQAQKCANYDDIEQFAKLTPGQAKRLGRRVKIRDDWEAVKVETMRMLVWQKFVDHDELAERLLATGVSLLVEGNNWGDRFWGRVNDGMGTGENWLGKILMETREQLRALPR